MSITQLPRRGPEFDLNLDKLRAAGAEVRSISGFCPVQAEASVDGLPFYFRARGEHWALHIGPKAGWCGLGAWWIERDYGDVPFDAGYMREAEALGFIEVGVALFRSGDPGIKPTIDDEALL